MRLLLIVKIQETCVCMRLVEFHEKRRTSSRHMKENNKTIILLFYSPFSCPSHLRIVFNLYCYITDRMFWEWINEMLIIKKTWNLYLRLVEFDEKTTTCEKLTYRLENQNGIIFLIILLCLLSNSSGNHFHM